MQTHHTRIFAYLAALAVLVLLCSAHYHHKGPKNKWKRMAKKHTTATVKQMYFEKGSLLAKGKPLMWGEWIINFPTDSLPKLKPFAPVPEYDGKAFVITGLAAYSNHNGTARAEIIYDCRDRYDRWDIDIFKPNPKGGEPTYHMSFYITGPEGMDFAK